MKLPRDSDTTKIKELDEQIAATTQQVAAELAKIQYVDPFEGSDMPADALTVLRQEVIWIDDELPAGAQPYPGAVVEDFATQSDYGFATLDRVAGKDDTHWLLTEYRADGTPTMRCNIVGSKSRCTAVR